MDVILSAFTTIFESFLYGVQSITEWLMKPWVEWGDFVVSPIMLFSFGGLMVVAAVMLIKFLNPVNQKGEKNVRFVLLFISKYVLRLLVNVRFKRYEHNG